MFSLLSARKGSFRLLPLRGAGFAAQEEVIE